MSFVSESRGCQVSSRNYSSVCVRWARALLILVAERCLRELTIFRMRIRRRSNLLEDLRVEDLGELDARATEIALRVVYQLRSGASSGMDCELRQPASMVPSIPTASQGCKK